MYKITIKGEASTNYPNPKELDGVDCQDDFAEYSDFSDDLDSGYMCFKFEDGKLMTYTVYSARREFSKEELEQLGEETQGQWSDGIGEGFEQYPCYNTREEYYDEYGDLTDEVYISPWKPGQELEIKQEQVEKQLN